MGLNVIPEFGPIRGQISISDIWKDPNTFDGRDCWSFLVILFNFILRYPSSAVNVTFLLGQVRSLKEFLLMVSLASVTDDVRLGLQLLLLFNPVQLRKLWGRTIFVHLVVLVCNRWFSPWVCLLRLRCVIVALDTYRLCCLTIESRRRRCSLFLLKTWISHILWSLLLLKHNLLPLRTILWVITARGSTLLNFEV